jgi:hypothetical protein
LVAAVAFALVIITTAAHLGSRAGATAYFSVLGALAFFMQAGVDLALTALAAQRGNAVGPNEAAALLHLRLYGFVAMFVVGVALRAVPTFSGVPRPELQAKVLAIALVAVVAVYVIAGLWIAGCRRTSLLFRVEAASFAGLGPSFLAIAGLVGSFRPAANRLRPASQQHVCFIRTGFAWLLIAAGLSVYYGVRGGSTAYRSAHSVGLGVASTMILGMGMLVLPEFAIRRMAHPRERACG